VGQVRTRLVRCKTSGNGRHVDKKFCTDAFEAQILGACAA
jgi:hypothetical protein